MRVAIIDDEQNERETLHSHLTRFALESGNAIDTDQYSSGDALLADYRLIYDIILLDVDMPGTNGIDTARQVRLRDENVTILFITNIAQYAINAFEVEAADYIIKPIEYYDFAMKFRRAMRRVPHRGSREIHLETANGDCRVRVSDIVYVEALDHYLTYHLQGKTFGSVDLEVRDNMKKHESLLKPYNFCRIHKSYLVNLARVRLIRTNELTIADTDLPIGRSYKKELMKEYLRFVRG